MQMRGMMNSMASQGKSMRGQGDQMKQMMSGRGMMGGGMMGGGMMGGAMGNSKDGITKKDLKTLTRTDFLLQFVWVPVKPENQPKTPEELKAKLDEIKTKLDEALKAYAVDTSSEKLEEKIEAESLKKSKAFDSGLEKALSGPSAIAPGTGPAAVPGGNVVPPAGATPKGAGAGPASK